MFAISCASICKHLLTVDHLVTSQKQSQYNFHLTHDCIGTAFIITKNDKSPCNVSLQIKTTIPRTSTLHTSTIAISPLKKQYWFE